MKYTDLIKEHNIKPGEPGFKKIQNMIAELQGIEKAIPIAEKQLTSGSLSVAKRKNLEKDLKAAQTAAPEMDAAVCDAISAWLPRREWLAKNVERLLEGKMAKAQGSNGAAAAGAGSTAPAASTEPTQKATGSGTGTSGTSTSSNNLDNGQQAPTSTTKKGSGWGWLIGGLIVLVGAVVGVNLANKAK